MWNRCQAPIPASLPRPATLKARYPQEGHASREASAGSPRPHTSNHRLLTADPNCPPQGRAAGGGGGGQRLTPDTLLRRHKNPPMLCPPATPTTQRRLAGACAEGSFPDMMAPQFILACKPAGETYARQGAARKDGYLFPCIPPDTDQKAPPTRPRGTRTERPRQACTSCLLSDTNNPAMMEPTAPRTAHPRSPALNEAHEVIRALGLRNRGGGPTSESSDSDVEQILPPRTAPGRDLARRPVACRPSAPPGGGALPRKGLVSLATPQAHCRQGGATHSGARCRVRRTPLWSGTRLDQG